MPDAVRLAEYFYIETGDNPGEGARILTHLKDAAVNLIGFHAFPSGGRAQIDFFVSDAAAFRAAAGKAGWKAVGPKKAFVIEGEDRVGALVGYFTKLAGAGVNVTAADAVSAGAGRFGAILWVKAGDVAKAAGALGAR